MNQEDRRMWLQFRHRYYTLSIMEYGLIFIQAIGYIICFMYVTFTFFEYQLPDIPLSTKAYRLSIKVDYMNVLCLILSIFLAFPRPKRLKQRFKLKLALIFLKDNDKDKVSYKKDIINEAKEFITEVDKYYQKKKEPTSEDKIVPHEKRMVLRKRMIEIGIPGVSILTAFLIFYFGWNVPQVASIDLFIGYVLVIFEAWYYQSLLKKEDVKMFSENQKIMIDEGVIKLSSKKLGTKKSKKKIVKKKSFTKNSLF
ncbi:MAG: hypothetical protein K2M91_09365 [Lachnospiraceae bacterium]|nr:hypothetical protein [Lachnospiraceae bacterium]